MGVGSAVALGHAKNQHGVLTSREEKKVFEAFCKDHRVCERPEQAPIPLAGGPPVRGIAAPVPGYSCRADPLNCRYSVRDFQTLLTHARLRHRQGLALNTDRAETMVQTIFQGVGRQYFEVDVTATAESNLDLRDYLRLQFLPSVKGDPILAAGSDRDRPPLLKITMWDEFEEEIRKDGEQRKAAWRIKQKHAPTELGGILKSLDEVVREHHSHVKKLLEETPHAFTVAKVLLNGPGFSPEQSKYFRFLSGDNYSYVAFFVQMIRAMVRKERGHEFKMTFVYTETQREKLAAFIERLVKDATEQSQHSKTEAILAYQMFCWSLVYIPEAKRLGAWDNPIRRCIWLMALRDDGSFMDATNLTPLLAKLKYFCRLVTLYEALGCQEPRDETEDAVDRVGRLHDLALKLGTPTTFNMVWELQQVASALAYSQVQDPNVFVDPGYTWISIGTETLHLDRLRSGMATLIQEAKAAFLYLARRDEWPNMSELHIVDDLGKTDRGYSFLEEAPFSNRRHEFFLSSVQNWKLGSFSRNGHWNWDETAIKEFLHRSDRMWANVIHVLFIGTQLSTRVAQFLQIQLRNADRPRNLIIQGKEAMFLGRYSKTTHTKGRDNCIPAFLAEPLRDLLLVLLGGGQRETQAILAGVIYGEESRSLYRTYLCVENGTRISAEAFYDTVKRRNRDFFQCAWGASDLRQGMITLGREFICQNETFPICADDLLAEAVDHSTEVDLTHYAVVQGAAPRLSPSSLAQHRWLAKEWSSLLGMGPQKPPEPVRTRGAIPLAQKPLDTRELAVQVSDMVADAIMSKLAAIGLTSDNIRKLTALGGGLSSPAAGEGLQEARTPVHMDDNTTGLEIPSTSFPRDPFHSSTSYNTSSTQLSTQRKRAAVPDVITSEGAIVSQPRKRVRLIEVDCKKKELVKENDEGQVNRLPIFHSSPLASKLPGYTVENVLVENVRHRDPEEDDLLRGNIRGAIQQLLQDPTAREKSKSQMDALLLIMRKRQDGFITMRTGGGKSMLWLVPPLLDPEARFIVVCPFTVLLDQQFELARRHGLQAVKYGLGDISRDVQILFVQVECVGCRKFCDSLTMKGTPKFTAMFVDEHHDKLSCPPDREAVWKRLACWASDQEFPLYLLSATAPPTLQQKLLDPYCLKPENTAFIRSPTNRQEIGLHTISTQGETGLRSLVHALAKKLKERERMLIFFNSCEQAERFSAENQCPVFHSKLPQAQHGKESNMQLWESGVSKMMACTSAFGAGVDKPNAAGRAGRDGTESHVFFTTTGCISCCTVTRARSIRR
ncbi:hypothetical protein EV363DRAFT_1329892 [Boletus edulis]|nr:hypothetical protein EV363DRAFT_1329892 [Boletus edulis]